MRLQDFRKEVEKKLKDSSDKDKVFFAWLCAVRALPYLGFQGDFAFWTSLRRKQYLQNIFESLDYTIYASTHDTIDVNKCYGYAISAAHAIGDVATAAFAAYSAAAAFDTVDYYFGDGGAHNSFAYAAYDVVAAVAVLSESDSERLQKIIFQDIEIINSERDYKQLNNDLSFCGEIWNSFQNALHDNNCDYWGQLYEDIFNNHFKIDENALARRLSVPQEIKELGASDVALFLIQEERTKIYRLDETRLIILGDKGAGKTCLARRLINPDASMTIGNESTNGVDTSIWLIPVVGGDFVKVHIWDCAGHVITHALHRFFMSERCVYIIVYDSRSEARKRLEYWLDHVKNYGGDSRVFILINKHDNYTPDIAVNNLKEQYDNIADFVTISLKDNNQQLKNFRERVLEEIKENSSWNYSIPMVYFKVKEEVENLIASTGIELMEYDKFEAIAKKYKVKDIDNLLYALHDLGICLWYKNMEGIGTLVLNPEWIIHAVYKVINWVHENRGYSVKWKDFNNIFSDESERYPEDKHEIIFNLMIASKLTYRVKRQNTLIIPQLLPEDRPKEISGFSDEDKPILRYVAERSLPTDTISRFIAEHNEEIKEWTVWRYGVALKSPDGAIALVRATTQEIKVYVKGINKIQFLHEIRKTFNDIFEKYKIKTNLEYNIRYRESKEIEPLYLDDSTIYGYAINGKEYFDPKCNRSINIESVVKEMNINNGNLMGSNGGMHIGETQTYKDSMQGMTVNNALPEKLEPKAYKDFIFAMEEFLKSEEAGKDLTKELYDKLEILIKEAKKEERSKRGLFNLKKGRAKNEEPPKWWKGLREFLSDGANFAKVATFAGAIGKFLVSHSNEISETARGLLSAIVQLGKVRGV